MGKLTNDLYDYDLLENGKSIKQMCIEKHLETDYSNNYFEYLEKDEEDGLVAHIYCTRSFKNGIRWQEILRFNNNRAFGKNNDYYSYGMSNGFKTFFNTHYDYYGAVNTEPKTILEEFNMDYVRMVLPKIYGLIQLQTNEEIIELDSTLRYFSYNNRYGEILSYINRYKEYPCIELLAKIDADYKFIYNDRICKLITKDKTFGKFLFKNRNFLNTYGIDCIQIYKGKTWQQILDERDERKIAKEFCQHHGQEFKEIKKKIPFTYKRLQNYLFENSISQWNYVDYIIACDYLRLDFSDTKVTFPKDFMAMHDMYTEVYRQHREEEQKERLRKEGEELNSSLLERAVNQSYIETTLNDGKNDYVTILPLCTDDFINEGDKLHHCVGRMGYNKKMANGEDVIIFLRKKEDIETPYVTIEWKITDKYYHLAQIYADHDSNPPEEVRTMVLNLLDNINNRIRKGEISIC